MLSKIACLHTPPRIVFIVLSTPRESIKYVYTLGVFTLSPRGGVIFILPHSTRRHRTQRTQHNAKGKARQCTWEEHGGTTEAQDDTDSAKPPQCMSKRSIENTLSHTLSGELQKGLPRTAKNRFKFEATSNVNPDLTEGWPNW